MVSPDWGKYFPALKSQGGEEEARAGDVAEGRVCVCVCVCVTSPSNPQTPPRGKYLQCLSYGRKRAPSEHSLTVCNWLRWWVTLCRLLMKAVVSGWEGKQEPQITFWLPGQLWKRTTAQRWGSLKWLTWGCSFLPISRGAAIPLISQSKTTANLNPLFLSVSWAWNICSGTLRQNLPELCWANIAVPLQSGQTGNTHRTCDVKQQQLKRQQAC